MPDRDWDKELAKVDKQMASLSDEALLQPAGGGKTKAGSGAPKGRAPISADTGRTEKEFRVREMTGPANRGSDYENRTLKSGLFSR